MQLLLLSAEALGSGHNKKSGLETGWSDGQNYRVNVADKNQGEIMCLASSLLNSPPFPLTPQPFPFSFTVLHFQRAERP